MHEKLKEYKTRDLYEAAFIYAQDPTKFTRLDPAGRDFLFAFNNQEKCEQLAQSYYSATGTVSGKKLADAIKTLKDLVFNRLREQQNVIR